MPSAQQERAADRIRAEAAAREQADRLRVCLEIEELEGEGAEDRIAELKVRWDALPPIPQEYAASLTRRFQDACRAFEDRERRRMLAQAAAGRLQTLASELEQLVASEIPAQELIARWRGLRRDAEVLREHAEANPEAADRLERAIAAIEEKEQEQVQVRQRQEQDNLRRLHQICRQVETLAASEQVTLKAGDRALSEIRSALEGRLPLPTKKDRQEVQSRLEAARAVLGPRVQELRDADEWQRWANLQVQEELAKKMEALAEEADLEVAARRMRELQGRWKQVALAPRTQGEALWRRFKTAQDAVFARTSAHLSAQNEERSANLAKKQALCEQAEALSGSSDWVKTATAIQALQAEWKTIGPVSRGSEKAMWERFRAACDQFFTRRHDDLKKRKDEWSENLARKEALCAQAEALAASTEWEAAAAQCKKLQAEWKQIGPVRRSKSDAVWQRFRAACDAFFDRYKHRDQVELQSKAAARADVIRDLEALAARASSAAADAGAGETAGGRARRARRQGPRGPGAVAGGARAAAHRAAGAGRELPPGARQNRGGVARGLCRHRPRSGQHAEADGEAAGQGRGAGRSSTAPRRRRRCRPPSCSRSAGASALRPTPWPAARPSPRPKNCAGARPSRKCAARSRSGPGSARCRPTWPVRSTSAFSAPAASSTISGAGNAPAPAFLRSEEPPCFDCLPACSPCAPPWSRRCSVRRPPIRC